MTELTRRRAVLGAMSAGAAALAGCLVEDDGSGDAPDDQTDDNSTDDEGEHGDEQATAELLNASLVHKWSDCAGGDGQAAVVHDGASYAVDGIATAPDPCHEPVLRDAAFEDGDLMVSIEVAQAEMGEDRTCMDCVGIVAYDALAEMSEADAVERVLVSHGDQEFEVPSAEFSTDPHIHEATIETTDTGCGNEDVDEASASLDAGTLTVEGRVSTSTPCYEARLVNRHIDGETLHLGVAARAREEMCVDCVGELSYEATVDLLNDDGLSELVVAHADGRDHHFEL